MKNFITSLFLITLSARAGVTNSFVLPSSTSTSTTISQTAFLPAARPTACTRSGSGGPLHMSLIPACIRVNDIVYSKLVVIFGVSDDAHTLRIQGLLEEGHVQFTTVYLDRLEDGPDMMEAITQMTGRSEIPCIYIDGKFVGGHDHIIAMNIEGHLGKMLQEIGAIPYDRMRDLKKIWRQPAMVNLNGTGGTPELT